MMSAASVSPLVSVSKTPYPVREGGERWGTLGPSDGAMIERWASRFRGCGWALRTGAIDGLWPHLVVVDVDDIDAAPDWIHDLDAFPWSVQTRRGLHLYSWTGEPLRSRRLALGEIKAERAYVVGWQPGGAYQPAEGFGVAQPPLFPARVLSDLLRTDSPPDTPDQLVSPRPNRPQTRLDASRRRPVPSPVSILPIGRRNVGLFRRLLVAAGRDYDLRGDKARMLGVAKWYNQRLETPLPDGEVVKLARSAVTYSEDWETSTDAFSERQRIRGQRSGASRRAQAADRDAQIRRMKAQGRSVTEIARSLGVTRPTVYQALRQRD